MSSENNTAIITIESGCLYVDYTKELAGGNWYDEVYTKYPQNGGSGGFITVTAKDPIKNNKFIVFVSSHFIVIK